MHRTKSHDLEAAPDATAQLTHGDMVQPHTIQRRAGTCTILRNNLGLPSATCRIEIDGEWLEPSAWTADEGTWPSPIGKLAGSRLTSSSTGVEVTWTVGRTANGDAVVAWIEVANHSTAAVSVGRLLPLSIAVDDQRISAIDMGGPQADHRVLVDLGNLWYARTRPLLDQGQRRRFEKEEHGMFTLPEGNGEHLSEGHIAIASPAGGGALVAGALTHDRLRTRFRVRFNTRRSLGFTAECDAFGFSLQPGAILRSELIHLQLCDDPLAALERYGDAVRVTNGIVLPPTPIGWMSWFAYGRRIDANIVARTARVLREKLPGYPLDTLLIDDGWGNQEPMICVEDWTHTNGNFPDGLAPVATDLAQFGLRLGLWSTLATQHRSHSIARTRPHMLLQGEDGNPAFQHWEDGDPILYNLDPTHPDSQAEIRRVYEAFRAWGVRYTKNDFTEHIARPWVSHHDPSVVRGWEVYRRYFQVMRSALGPGITIQACCHNLPASVGVVDSSRIAWDIEPNTPVGNRHYPPRAGTIAARWFMHRRFFINDPDAVCVDEAGGLEAARMRAAVVALSGGSVFLDVPVEGLWEAGWRLFSQVIPPSDQAARPLDLFTARTEPRRWGLLLERTWGRRAVVGLFDFDSRRPHREILDAREALPGCDPDRVAVLELWTGTTPLLNEGRLVQDLAPSSCRVFHLVELSEQPRLLGTDLHILGGAVELVSERWDSESRALTMIFERPAGSQGQCWIASLHGQPSFVEADGKQVVTEVCADSHVTRLPLAFATNRLTVVCRWS